jgi:ubiquinone/menaquinone biosynthesis C-methylase UbiE
MTVIDQPAGTGVFAFRVARTLNSGFTTMMISVGHRTGLFDVMAALPPATSQEIASAAGLTERYVREWLAAMTSAHIVDYDARTATFFLPIEYASVLARGAGSDSLAPAAQILSLLASVEDLVVARFQDGGGVTPEAYEKLSAVLSAGKRELIDESYLDAVLRLIPGMRTRLAEGALVLDVGCGDGALINALARAFPRSKFRGYDIARAAIERACDQRDEAGVHNVEFILGDVMRIDEPRTYDLVLALESLHELPFPTKALRAIAANLTRDGVFLMQEAAASSHLSRNVEHPFAPMLYALSCMHAVPVALGDERGEALGRMWGQERATRMLDEAGFRDVRFETLEMDPLSYYCVAMKQ